MTVLLGIGCIIQVFFAIMLPVRSIQKSRIHFRLLQIDAPEEFADFEYGGMSVGYKGSLCAKMKLFFTLIPYYKKKTDVKDEEYRGIEKKLVSATKRQLIVCGGFVLFWCLLIGIDSAMG